MVHTNRIRTAFHRPFTRCAWAIPLVCAFTIAATLLAAGCKDEKKITPPPPPRDPIGEQSSPDNILASLRTAYEKRNFEEYAKLFSTDYSFVFNPGDVGDPENPTPQQWFRQDEMDSARNLFSNDHVEYITLSWNPREAVPSDDVIPGSWKVRVDAVDLNVHTRSENGEIWIYQVRNSWEVFYFREDPSITLPSGQHKWECIRWDDMPIGGKTRVGGSGTKVEDKTWGQIKARYAKSRSDASRGWPERGGD